MKELNNISLGTWLEDEWFDLCDTIYRFKDLLRRRGINVTERKGYDGGGFRMSPCYRIIIRRDASDPEKLIYLIHEFVHFELGHRGSSVSIRAANEIEALLVSHIVNWIFYLEVTNEEFGIYGFLMPNIYRKACEIADELIEIVFDSGRRPGNHNWLLTH